MINRIFRLTEPKVFSVEYEDLCMDGGVLLRPTYMSVCRADQRYYFGQRPTEVLKKKLPMALIHEAAATVVHDPSGRFLPGQQVVMVPNVPPKQPTQSDIYENYAEGSAFLSSGIDGFLREYICMPTDRLVAADGIKGYIASSAELMSVCIHAVRRFEAVSHSKRDRIGIWGDGSVAYFLAVVLKNLLPEAKLCIIGKSPSKLAYFSFCDEVYDASELEGDFYIDHAFECCGGEGSSFAFDDIIKYIRPQGCVLMMGVSENKIPLLTRMILEKGLIFVGSSRSGVEDFVCAAELLRQPRVSQRIERVTEFFGEVRSINQLHAAFERSVTGEFKTAFCLNI